MMSGEGIAAIITAGAAFISSIGTMIMQIRQGRVSQANSDKLDEQGGKIDEVHFATTQIAEQTGAHKAIEPRA